jgi:FixJ family two-component response regulator
MQPAATPPLTQAPPLVAVIDADAALRQRLRIRLEALGAEVDAHATANAFLASLAARLPACLITDAALPDWPPADLLAELHRRGLDIPTLVMAASGDVRTAVTALRHGALDCVEKPLIERALAAHVAVFLRH